MCKLKFAKKNYSEKLYKNKITNTLLISLVDFGAPMMTSWPRFFLSTVVCKNVKITQRPELLKVAGFS